ncbi:synaptotagmin-14b isoform X2 [Hippoglossus hippoglossus]|uniref:synaptotagmin-14b isoform X2 n=1 Tax=Hippoglossus hippoglossus TaxID=8267 RepID=UPI00148D4400|nr:synaptotagmin-14b isoform X2 [Hippoglossus hippoglossus]
MAFFKSFQQNLPSVNISSILDSVTSRVDDLANAVSDATYAVSDQLSEQVTTVIKKVHEEEDGESNGSGQGAAQTSTAQEGKGGGKSMWPMNRDAETSSTASKNNQTSDSAEADRTQSQMEWEWRDGCWRVKKTEAELAEEERKKKEEKELQEKREQRRRERREKQLEKEAQRKKEEEREGEEEAEEKTDEGRAQGRKMSDSEEQSAAQQGADDCADAPHSPETESRAREKKPKEEGEEEEGVENGVEREGDDEGEAELPVPPSTVKKKKSDKKKKKGKDAKEDSKKPGKASDVEKKKEKGKKSKKKKKGNQEGVLSDSEEDRGLEATAQQNTTSAWSSERKQSSEQGGYSSEASSEHANSIQRIKKDSSLNELQPPPYQDKGSAPRVSSRSERGLRRGSPPQRCDSPRGSSEASGDQDTESYLNKGCEEDIPSDSTAVLGPEDGCGLQLPTAYEPEPLAKYGTLDVAFEYDSSEQWLAVTVTAATDIPALKQTGNISWQVHLVLLPTKKQRAKTGVQKGPCPIFTETFKFSRVEQEALGDYAVRFRLYSIRRMKKEKVLGEKVFYLTKLNLQGKIALPVTLEPGSELAGCGSVVSVSRSAGAMTYRSTEDSSLPEILLGLIYNSATGRLSAEVIQGSHFKTTASDKPVNGLFCCIKHFVGGQLYIMRDTYVKLTMLDSKGKEMSKCKTAVCRGQPNPTYKETFMFQVALFQLSEVSLVVSVFCRRSSMKPRERLGCVSLGLNSTGEEQQAHWTEMKDAEGQQVCHWHTLTDT